MSKPRAPGAFITLEGFFGAGKTTHMDFIEAWLQDRGLEVTRTREPGGTPLGELLRNILLHGGLADGAPDAGRSAVRMSDRAELMLLFAARAQQLDEVIAPALAAGRWVVCDRFIDSTYAYQGAGRGMDEAAIAALEKWLQNDAYGTPHIGSPDLTILLDVSVDAGLARRRMPPDRFGSQPREFQEAVRQEFLARADRFERIKRIDAERRSRDEVRADIGSVLQAFWQRRWVASDAPAAKI